MLCFLEANMAFIFKTLHLTFYRLMGEPTAAFAKIPEQTNAYSDLHCFYCLILMCEKYVRTGTATLHRARYDMCSSFDDRRSINVIDETIRDRIIIN